MTDKEKQNAKQLPSMYYCRHMESGLCGYGEENVLIDADAMKKMAPSFVGKPIYVGHRPEVGQFMRGMISTLPDDNDGHVIESFYNPLDGWLWAKMLVTSDYAHDMIKKDWKVSNAYLPKMFQGGAGEHHNVDYDRKISEADFTHLAIVPDPRYENAKIFTPDEFKSYQAEKTQELQELQNNKGVKKMLKFFRTEKKELSANEISDDAFVELTNAKGETVQVTIKEMINAVEKDEQEKKNADDKDKDEKINMDMSVPVGGKNMKLSELVNQYTEMCQKANSADTEDDDENMNAGDDKKEEDKDEKKNADDADKAKEEKQNAKKKNFDALKNAHLKADLPKVSLSVNGVERGKSLYGSQK